MVWLSSKVINVIYREVDGGESLDTETETFLNQTVTQVEDLLNSSQTTTTTQEQFDKAQATLQQGFISVKEITQALSKLPVLNPYIRDDNFYFFDQL